MKISIVTPCYNSAATIEDTLQSIGWQSYSPIEHLVVDGNSSDGTMPIINRYRDRIARVISEADRGLYSAINKGVKMASGDIVGILNSDDVYHHPRVVEKVVKTFRNKKTDAVYGDLQYVDAEDTKVLRHWEAGPFKREKLQKGWMPPHPTFFVRNEVYRKYGVFNEQFDIAADYDLILRFLYKQQISVSYIPEVLVRMKIGGASNEGFKARLRTFAEDYRAARINGFGVAAGLKAQLLKRLHKVGQFVR